jgi:translation initiation factor RLI1
MVQMLKKRDERGKMEDLAEKLDLKQVMDRNVENLSGGELQRFAIAMCAGGKADVYMIDEPSSYLDVRQRLKAAQARSFASCFKLPVMNDNFALLHVSALCYRMTQRLKWKHTRNA